jgi:hypothetical protein
VGFGVAPVIMTLNGVYLMFQNSFNLGEVKIGRICQLGLSLQLWEEAIPALSSD